MSDKIIGKINDGWLMVFCIMPFAIYGYVINDVFTNIAIFICWTIAIISYIIKTLTDNGYNIYGLKNYEISQGTVNLLAIQFSTLSIVELKYHIFSSLWQSASPILRLVLFIAGLLYLIMNIAICKGFVVKKKEEQTDAISPVYHSSDIPKDAACVLSALDCYEDIIIGHRRELNNLESLKIPVPNEYSENNKAPFVDYLQTLSKLPKSYPEFAALEQFTLMVADNSQLDNFGEDLTQGLGVMAKDGLDYAGGLKDLLVETKSSIINYLSNRTEETSQALLNNIQHCMQLDFHGQKFHFDISHAEGIREKIATILKHTASDTGKGIFHTFFKEDNLHELNTNFSKKFSEHIDDLVSSISTDIDMDLWDPDFNSDAHFPLFSTAIELCRLGGKLSDDDVDMEKATIKSGVKIGMTASGAYLGGVIGSFLFPGAGTAIGAMIGGWLGRFGANKINKAETKRLQNELNEQVERIKERAKEAEQNIEQYQLQVAEKITNVAQTESESFDEVKYDSPLAKFSDKSMLQAVSIIIGEYLVHFIHDIEHKYGVSKETEMSELRKYLPSSQKIKIYPKESLSLMLSSQNYIRTHFKEDAFYNSKLVNEICLYSIIQRISLMKTLQTLWYHQVFNNYKTAIANIMQKSNDSIKEYVDNVDLEKQAIDNEVVKADKIKKELDKEMKTN